MKFLTLSRFLLVLILPLLIFLLALNFLGFDNLFYTEKFSEYNIQQNVPGADSLHEKVMNFINGKTDELPKEFDYREKQHLLDVRNLIKISTVILYTLIVLFLLLLVASSIILKANNYVINFVGKVLIFGGFLTVTLAALLFLFINSDFSTAFESFHQMLFEKGTYSFDPAKEIITNLYPEQLFMDLGLRISKWAVAGSVILVLLGAFLVFKSKKNIKKHKSKFQKQT